MIRFTFDALARHASKWPRTSNAEPQGSWLDPHNEKYKPSMPENASGANGFVRISTVEDIARIFLQQPFGSEECTGWDCATWQREACTGENVRTPCDGLDLGPSTHSIFLPRIYSVYSRPTVPPRLNYFNLSKKAARQFCLANRLAQGKASNDSFMQRRALEPRIAADIGHGVSNHR